MSTEDRVTGSKPNAQLSSSEREAKRKLKFELKFQRKKKKIETRIKHAISRKDPVIEQSAREELRALLLTRADDDEDGGGQLQVSLQHDLCPPNDAQSKAALDEILQIFRMLLASIDDDEQEKVPAERLQQTERARHLLRNMTKATQTKCMFKDVAALRGYARQKFHERAALIVESFGKLSPASRETASSLHRQLDSRQREECVKQQDVMKMCWEKLGSIQKVCSIGCGPGNDVVGIVGFLRGYLKRTDAIREVCLLDYAISEWKDAVLDALIPILAPEFASKVTCASCDVTLPMKDALEQCIRDSDIFLTSYLLTETRGSWHEFFIRLVDIAKVGAVFCFSEPVPWQLHHLLRMSTPGPPASDASNSGIDSSPLSKLRFAWVDSSMNFPDIQKLDKRSGGPAVLLAMKVLQ